MGRKRLSGSRKILTEFLKKGHWLLLLLSLRVFFSPWKIIFTHFHLPCQIVWLFISQHVITMSGSRRTPLMPRGAEQTGGGTGKILRRSLTPERWDDWAEPRNKSSGATLPTHCSRLKELMVRSPRFFLPVPCLPAQENLTPPEKIKGVFRVISSPHPAHFLFPSQKLLGNKQTNTLPFPSNLG